MALFLGANSSLSIDLERLVISYIPIRPRLLVLSYVCKRWRRLVLETLEQLPQRRYVMRRPTYFMRLVRLISLCPNIRRLPLTVDPWPTVPNVPKLEHFSLDCPKPSDQQIEFLRRSTCLTSLFVLIDALPILRDHAITLDSFPHLRSLKVTGQYASVPADEWARLSLPSLTELYSFVTTAPKELLLLRPHFSKIKVLSFSAWGEDPNGFLNFIFNNASSFSQLTELSVTRATASLHLDLATAQRLLATCPSLETLYFCDSISIEPAVQQLLVPYCHFFRDCNIEDLSRATPGLGRVLSLRDKSLSDYPHLLPYLSRVQTLSLKVDSDLDLSSAVGVTSLNLELTKPVVVPEDILTKWRIPTLRTLRLHQPYSGSLGFGSLLLPLLQVLFAETPLPSALLFAFPCLTEMEIDISDPPTNKSIDPARTCGLHFEEFVALLPRIEASGIHVLRARRAREIEAERLLEERQKHLWLDVDPGSVS